MYRCVICNLNVNDDLKQHYDKHIGEAELLSIKQTQCSICGENIIAKYMKDHMESHEHEARAKYFGIKTGMVELNRKVMIFKDIATDQKIKKGVQKGLRRRKHWFWKHFE